MKLQQFSGGKSTRTAPQYLSIDMGVEHSNVDFNSGTLKPIKAKVDSGVTSAPFPYYYDAKSQWLSSQTRRDYVEFQQVLYWTDRVGVPQRYDGIGTLNLGIAAPTAFTAEAADVIDRPVDVAVSFDATGDIAATSVTYVIVNTTATGVSEGLTTKVNILKQTVSLDLPYIPGRLSAYSQNSTVTRTSDAAVLLGPITGFTYGPGGVKVYRLYEGAYRLVGTASSDTDVVVDNTYDIGSNAELDDDDLPVLSGTYQYLYTFYNSSNGIESAVSTVSNEVDLEQGGFAMLSNLQVSTDPQVDKKRIYRVGGSLTTFTRVAEIANSATTFYDDVSDTDVQGSVLSTDIDAQAPAGLAFLTESYAMLFGAKASTLRFTPIGQPHAWPETYSIEYGAEITGLAAVANGVLVFTKFKTHIVTGTGPTSLATQLLTSDQGCIAFESVQTIGGTAFWASTDGICASSGSRPTVVSKDRLGKIALTPVDSAVFDEVYYCLNADGVILAYDFQYTKGFFDRELGVTSLTVADDVLYGYSGGSLYKLFASTEPESFKYKSPRFIEGSATEHKTYKKVYLYSKGAIQCNIIINDVVVATKSLSGEDNHVMQVPSQLQRGFFVQFELSGTGEVYEIEYKVGESQQNG